MIKIIYTIVFLMIYYLSFSQNRVIDDKNLIKDFLKDIIHNSDFDKKVHETYLSKINESLNRPTKYNLKRIELDSVINIEKKQGGDPERIGKLKERQRDLPFEKETIMLMDSLKSYLSQVFKFKKLGNYFKYCKDTKRDSLNFLSIMSQTLISFRLKYNNNFTLMVLSYKEALEKNVKINLDYADKKNVYHGFFSYQSKPALRVDFIVENGKLISFFPERLIKLKNGTKKIVPYILTCK
ncbi:hypothetical protein [Winogradskyella sp.]|uniref:hypothetical protein n=1 Tax=Winogradskyella sp. TaxID=1883156 RepID=UPI00260B2E39|nr:hypothetical protein [Winogradskyella sp.]